jgi:hypothetical protein
VNLSNTLLEMSTGFISLRIGCYGHDNETLDFVKRCEFLEQLADCQLLTSSAPQNWQFLRAFIIRMESKYLNRDVGLSACYNVDCNHCFQSHALVLLIIRQ